MVYQSGERWSVCQHMPRSVLCTSRRSAYLFQPSSSYHFFHFCSSTFPVSDGSTTTTGYHDLWNLPR